MKLTLILIFSSVMMGFAIGSYSQSTKLTVQLKQATLLEIINEIENQSEFQIAYNSSKLDVNQRVSVNMKNQTVDKILSQVLEDSKLKYEIIDRYIIITDDNSSSNNQNNIQQDKTIRGKVTNQQGEAIPGVTVIEKGTTKGTITDIDGNFSLTVSGSTDALVFSFVGMLTKEVPLGTETTITVQLEDDVIGIDEVIAVGYATQKKINLTGAVIAVDAEKITARPITQTSSALQGLAPGVVVTQNLGSPGDDVSTIRIRGRGSISSDNSPLILVDGIQVENINDVNPEDIASMSVLKDAASAAIYGARAANGVILITTKRGKKGAFSVNADLSYGAQIPTMVPEFVELERQMQYEDVKRLNEGLEIENGATRVGEYINWFKNNEANDQYQNNDWYNAVIAGSAALHREQITMSGGSDKLQARLSMVNMDQNGLIANSQFNRKSLRSNVDITPYEWLKFTTDIFIQHSEQTSPARGVYQMLNELEPYRAMRVGDGLWGSGWQGNNPLAFVEAGGNSINDNDYTLINLNAYIKPIKGLNIEIGYSNLLNNNQINAFTDKFDYYDAGANAGDDPILMGSQPTFNWLSITNQKRQQNYYKAIATYETIIKDHNIKVLFGGDAIDFAYSTSDGYRANFPLGIAYRQLSVGAQEGMDNGSSANEWSMASLLGRLNYIYQGKYMLEASFRYDGSSRFSNDTRWGFFPSVSAGWRISEEAFMQNADFISNFKLRASWGQLGNQNIGSNYPYQSLVDLQQPAVYGEASHQGAAITQWAVSNISWETSEQTNFGFDFGFLNNKLSGSFDYYVKNTSDILLILAIPNSTGLSANYQNGAEMENKGWELVVNWEDKVGDFSYYITGQLDDNKNKITNLLSTGPYIDNDRIREVGEEFDAMYGWESDGLLSKADLDDPTVPKHNSSNIIEGSLKFKDQNGDGVIDSDDRVVIGSETPRYNYSFLTGVTYKGIGLDIILQGVGQRDGYVRRTDQKYGDYLYEWESDFYLPADHKIFTDHNYGQFGLEPNTDASLPAIGSDRYLPFSDFWLRSRAYLRIKNITLSYTLPKSVTNKMGLGNVRFYVSGENLYTFTNFIKGFDPEMASGKGFWQYPNISKVMGGINLTF